MGKTSFQITGGKEIARVLREIPKQYQRKALTEAFRAGAEIVAAEARQQAARAVTADFAADIIVARPNAKERRSRGQGQTIVVVGLKRGRRRSRLAHLFEFGTADRYGQDGHFTGKIKISPFFRPAMDNKGAQAILMIAQRTRENLEIIARQLARGSKVSLSKKNRK